MGYRNHLHICQHCGVVHATASSTGPETCGVCDAFTFSPYELNSLLQRGNAGESVPSDTDAERGKRTTSMVVQS